MGKMMFCRMCVFAAMYEWEYECSFVSASMQQCKSLFLCICINICLNFSCVRSYFSDSKSKKWHPLLFLKIVTCINMEWGFKMRYYKGHMFLCQSYFNFFFLCFFFFNNQALFFFQSHISYGIPGLQVSTAPLCFIPLSFEEGEMLMLLLKKKRQLFHWMKGKKQGLDNKLHAVLLI